MNTLEIDLDSNLKNMDIFKLLRIVKAIEPAIRSNVGKSVYNKCYEGLLGELQIVADSMQYLLED